MTTVILHTVHGSHLYGLANESSDLDIYRVVDGERSRQCLADSVDITAVALNDFVGLAGSGSPQALEALWSPVAAVHPHWAPFLDALRPGTAEAARRFTSTIRAFVGPRPACGQIKARRHALRLALELDSLLCHGRFDPVLTPRRRRWVVESVGLDDALFARRLRSACPVEL